jgi:hypothetical protein
MAVRRIAPFFSVLSHARRITRIIMPIVNQPSLFPTFGGLVPSTTDTGFGDFNPTE